MHRIIFLLLFPLTIFAQKKSPKSPKDISVDSSSKILICLSDSANETIYFECFRWNKWVKIDSIQRKITDADTCFLRESENYSTEEQYRLEYKFPDESLVYSRVAKLRTDYSDSCSKLGPRFIRASRITLNCPSRWEIYDQKGTLVKTGYSDIIYISDLQKGGYVLNFANSSAEFFKQ